MPPKRTKTKTGSASPHRVKKFADELKDRLVLRSTGKYGVVYHLDFRASAFKALGRKKQMLRDPYTFGWPGAGAPTADKKEAERWIERRYAASVLQELDDATAKAEALGKSGPMTVGKACDTYLDEYRKIPGHSEHTYRNHRSYINKVIKPRLGHLPLAAVTNDLVENMIENMKIEKVNADGIRVAGSPAPSTKIFVRSIMNAVWKAVLPDIRSPFVGPELGRGNKELARRIRQEIQAGNLKTLITDVFRDDLVRNLRRMLIAAIWYDRVMVLERRNMRSRAVANTAAALACFLSHGLRLGELMELRWFCIREDHGVIIIPGTKSEAGLRAMPLQEQFRPWLALLREVSRPAGAPADWMPDENDFVFPTRPGNARVRGSARALSNRISEALRWAGLKRNGEATHFGRKILVSMTSAKISAAQLKRYIGHAEAFEGATDVYLFPMIDAIPPEHRHLVQYLPSPDELLPEVAAFVPAERPDITQRKNRKVKDGEEVQQKTQKQQDGA